MNLNEPELYQNEKILTNQPYSQTQGRVTGNEQFVSAALPVNCNRITKLK